MIHGQNMRWDMNRQRVFIDCCVFMDFFQGRTDDNSGEKILALGQQGKIECYTSSLVICTLAYLFEKYKLVSRKEIPLVMKSLVQYINILPVESDDILKAIDFPSGDFEDDVEKSCAEKYCDCIITRNKKDFKNSDLKVFSPEEFIADYLRS